MADTEAGDQWAGRQGRGAKTVSTAVRLPRGGVGRGGQMHGLSWDLQPAPWVTGSKSGSPGSPMLIPQGAVFLFRTELCPQVHMLKFKSARPQNVSLFGDGAFKEVIKVQQGHIPGPDPT